MRRIGDIDRAACRADVEERFTNQRMARDYIRADYTREPLMVYFFGHLNKDSPGFDDAANAFRAVCDDAEDADA